MAMVEWKRMSLQELEALLQVKMDELYALRREIDRRKGNVPEPTYVNFEKYVTK